MDFATTPEQQQLADAVRRWVSRDHARAEGPSGKAWATIVELGLTALPVPAAHGGFDGSAIDLAVVLQEFGRGLVAEPYLSTVLGAELLLLGGRHGGLLEQVADGSLQLACAFGERQARHDLRGVRTRASADGDGWRLRGEKAVVPYGADAGALLVSARTSGEEGEEDGVSLFVVPAATEGLRITAYPMLDGQRGADVQLDDVRVGADALAGAAGQAWDMLDAAADLGAALLCAEAVGAMEALFDATLDYLKTRQQFGAPIGRFQALQHRMADMAIHLEQARSLALLAATKARAEDATERRRAVSAAKYRIGLAARFIGQQAVQLHGGMGVTDELPAAHYFKRLTTIALTLGDGDHHLARFIAQPGFADSAAEVSPSAGW
jgi:alkylation response protein AidB-like acyl-CoA dehydrogenase